MVGMSILFVTSTHKYAHTNHAGASSGDELCLVTRICFKSSTGPGKYELHVDRPRPSAHRARTGNALSLNSNRPGSGTMQRDECEAGCLRPGSSRESDHRFYCKIGRASCRER